MSSSLRSVHGMARATEAALVREYEDGVATATATRHAIAFAYGRTALGAALAAVGIEAGREVVLSPLTCQAVPLVLHGLHLRPVYADVDPATLNLAPAAVARALTPATGAILFQHTYGIGAGLRDVAALAREAGVPCIEDRAQCLPLAQRDAPLGERTIAIFSNNLRKPLPAGGGGLAVTQDDALANAMREARDALPPEAALDRARLQVEVLLHRRLLNPARYWLLYGLHRRLLAPPRGRTVAASVAAEVDANACRPSPFRIRQGLAWLARLPFVAAHVRRCVTDYAEQLGDWPEQPVSAAARERELYYYPVRVRNKAALLREAQRRRIELIAWPVRMPIFPLESAAETRALGYEPGSCPEADRLADELVGLPTDERITHEHRRAIVELVRGAGQP